MADFDDIDLTATEEDNRLPTVYPSLVIGLGGTGIKSLRYLRRRLKDEFGSGIKDEPGLIQLLGVDTVPLENRSSVEALHQHEYAYIGGFNAKRVIQNIDKFEEIKEWWDWNTDSGLPLGYISTGAKQLRTIGRLALYRRFHMYNSRVEAKLNRLAYIQAHRDMHEQRRQTQDQLNLPHIFIVSSLAGGTGSGTFLDIACHLRNRLEDQARIIGIFVMPSVFEEDIPSLLQQRRIKANSYAALKELEHFQSGNVFRTRFPEQGPIELEGGIFTHVFLIDRPNVSGFQVSTQSDVQQLIADFIFQVTVTPMAGEIWEMDANVSRERDDQKKSLSYSALGYSSLAVDERGRFEKLHAMYATSIYERMEDWGAHWYADAVEEARGKIVKEIGDKVEKQAVRLDTSDETVTPRRVYEEVLRGWARGTIVLPQVKQVLIDWGVGAAQSLVDALIVYYDDLVKNKKRAAELQKAHERLSDKGLSQTEPGMLRRALDALTNRSGPSETDQRRTQNALAAEQKARLDMFSFRLEQEGAAPDLLVFLRQLAGDLTQYRALLGAAGGGIQAPVNPPLDPYPLRTLLEVGGNDLDNAGDGFFTTVGEAAAELTEKWTVDNGHESAPAIELFFGDAQSARYEFVRKGRELTEWDAASRTDLYSVLFEMHSQDGGREVVHDLLRDFIRRCVPFVRLDFDRHNFSEKNIEPSYLLCMPKRLMEDFTEERSVFWALASSDYDFMATGKPNHRPDRMDALCVSHGYPLSVFADLPNMFNEYISPILGASPLHLQCCWRWQMDHVYPPTPEEVARENDPALQERFRKLCQGNCSDSGKSSGQRKPEAGSPPDKPAPFQRKGNRP